MNIYIDIPMDICMGTHVPVHISMEKPMDISIDIHCPICYKSLPFRY